MTPEEVIDFFAPQQSSVDAITEWLVSSGISADRFALSANKQVITPEITLIKCFISSILKSRTVVDAIRCHSC